MHASHFPWQKRRLRKEPLDDKPLSPPLEDQADNIGGGQQRIYWHLVFCYFLHAFLVVLHLVLLGIALSHHAERRVVIQNDIGLFTTGLRGGLQAFYTLYTALLVFVTHRLMLSSIFTSPKKLTQIHDICGAWAGLGAALSTLWQQTKVASSVLSIALVTVYFACISVLHIISTTLIQLQPFNDTTTGMGPVLGTWPNASINITSLDWTTVTALVPYLQDMYGNTTNGLANNTLYDVPLSDFIDATVPATMVNANCGLLTNLSISEPPLNGVEWNVTVSMSALGPITITIFYPPSPNEIWLAPSIVCYQPICSTLILYLVSAEMEVDDSLGGTNEVYINGSYYVPNVPSVTIQNYSTPVYFVACSLNVTNHTISLDSSGIQLDSSMQSTDVAWSAFSPGSDLNLTYGISIAMADANSALSSPYCQPEEVLGMSSMSPFKAYMSSILGLNVSSCSGASSEQYTSNPILLTRNKFESTVSQFAAEFLWLAGELGTVGGGFDRQTEEAPILSSVTQWKLNINTLPVIIALCSSVILVVLVIFSLRRHHEIPMLGAGVLEMMWFGSRLQVLRNYLSDVQTPSLDSLRASSMFETIFWTRSASEYEGSNNLYAPVPLHNRDNRANSSGPLDPSGSEVATIRLGDASRGRGTNNSRARWWCYALHIVLIALHITLLALLVHHPEQSVVIPSETSTFTVGLSALLQGVYTLYSAVLVLFMQWLALFKIVSDPRKLTTIHDVSGAWTGVGSAINILWRQRKTSSSTWEVLGVGAYLTLMLVLHITSSSIMQWQAFNGMLTGIVQTNLALPDSSVNLSQVMWTEIFPVASWIGANLSTPGLWNTTLYDVLQNPNEVTFTSATVNATTLTTQCGLVPNLTLFYEDTNPGEYQINFQDGTNNGSFFYFMNNGSFFEYPITTGSMYSILPGTQCTACSQTLFYMITTGINVDESVDDTVLVGLNSSNTQSSGESNYTIIPTYIAACSVNAQTTSAPLNIQSSTLGVIPDKTTVPASSSWSLWSPGNATDNTNIGNEIAATLLGPLAGDTDSEVTLPVDMNNYIISQLGLNSSNLSPWQLENAIAQTLANFVWLAGQLGENGGGFQRSVGESQAISNIVQFRLHLNTAPVIVASVAALLSLILAAFIIGKPSGKRFALVTGTSVLECLWLEAHSESIHDRMETVKDPQPDRLRAAGMFDICLGDIGRASYPETEQPILVPADG